METQTPWGMSIESNLVGFRAVATTFAFEAVFLVPFACGFGWFSLGWLYGEQWTSGQFHLGRSLFGLPFLFGTLMVGWQAAMNTCGRVVVSSEGDEASVFEGVGPLGKTRRFRWTEVERIGEGRLADTRRSAVVIQLDFRDKARPVLKFGSMLSDKRLKFLLAQLQEREPRK